MIFSDYGNILDDAKEAAGDAARAAAERAAAAAAGKAVSIAEKAASQGLVTPVAAKFTADAMPGIATTVPDHLTTEQGAAAAVTNNNAAATGMTTTTTTSDGSKVTSTPDGTTVIEKAGFGIGAGLLTLGLGWFLLRKKT